MIETAYDEEFLGLRARQDFRVINLAAIDAEEIWRHDFSGLAPFVPVMRGGDQIPLVRRALATVRASEPLQEMEALLAFLARLVMNQEIVKQLARWDLNVDVFEQNWFYQEIIQKGRQEGRQEGEAEILLRLLAKRCGSLNTTDQLRVRSLTQMQLETLSDALDGIKTHADLTTWLAAHS